MQREWRDDPKGQVKLLAYKPKDKEWSAVHYPLDATEEGWIGLSEITAHDGQLFIVERDNLVGEAAKVKKRLQRRHRRLQAGQARRRAAGRRQRRWCATSCPT